MKKHALMCKQLHELMSDLDISDESIYVIYQFLADLLTEFDDRLKKYTQELEAIKNELWLQNDIDKPSI